ncbi:hypothetical protein AVEN_83854-1 [Araneus ventricosus]|uniref:Mos1 transposase HTH domain-containing protein n=1 Tax=Araneus ventricosus TaxID=182803 RepID=A0A4Y2S1I8_ARAVE|nr:hypothetical protein AVEN_83854-1 [Araneus ventricosus]
MSLVYGANFMRDGAVQEWCRTFKDGRTDAHDEGRQERKTVTCEDLVQAEERSKKSAFRTNVDLQDAMETYLSRLVATFYEEGIREFVHRYGKYLILNVTVSKSSRDCI